VWRVSTPAVPARTHGVPRLGSTAARLKLKGIDGGPHKQRSVWFNSMQREEPYQGLTWRLQRVKARGRKACVTGAAWLSSARAVRCWVKSRNERNPRAQLCFWADGRDQPGGRWGRRQVSTAPTSWATHTLQWPVQRALPSREAERIPAKPAVVQIGGCNPPP
jgi:hypothetical protein